MKTHFYKNKGNSDISFTNKNESVIFDALPDETLMTEDIIYTIYDLKRAQKPSEYPFMSRSSISQYLRLLSEKKFLKTYQPFELRNSLKLGR